jgi:ABC-type multidrug transport system ATPase subunit
MIVCVTHDLASLDRFDRVILISHGAILADDTPHAIRSSADYRRLEALLLEQAARTPSHRKPDSQTSTAPEEKVMGRKRTEIHLPTPEAQLADREKAFFEIIEETHESCAANTPVVER